MCSEHVLLVCWGSGGGFHERLQQAKRRLAGLPSERVSVADAQWCEDTETLDRLLHHFIEAGGEGVVLRHSASQHRAGRSRDVLKVKSSYDAEALPTVGIEPASGWPTSTAAYLASGRP